MVEELEDMLQRSMLRSAITAKARSRKSEMNYHYKIILYKIQNSNWNQTDCLYKLRT